MASFAVTPESLLFATDALAAVPAPRAPDDVQAAAGTPLEQTWVLFTGAARTCVQSTVAASADLQRALSGAALAYALADQTSATSFGPNT